MSQLFIQGTVLHEAGPWGEQQPVAGARIEVLCGDEALRGVDLIMLASTNTKGEFQGLTTEWRSTVVRTIPDPAKPWKSIQVEEPDLDEPLILRARIRQNTARGAQVVVVPIAYVDDNTPIAPLVVPWGPAEASVIGVVNGHACTTSTELLERTVIQLTSKRAAVKLEAFGHSAEPYLELTAPTARQARLASALHLPSEEILRLRTLLTCNEDMASCNLVDGFWISTVIASIIFAPTTSPAAAAFGLALQRLLFSGYEIRSVGNAGVTMDGLGVAIRLEHPAWKADLVSDSIE